MKFRFMSSNRFKLSGLGLVFKEITEETFCRYHIGKIFRHNMTILITFYYF